MEVQIVHNVFHSKRKCNFEGDLDKYSRKRKRNILFDQICLTKNRTDEPRRANINREESKIRWRNAYRNRDNDQFCEKFYINRETFDFILSTIYPYVVNAPTDIIPTSIESEK